MIKSKALAKVKALLLTIYILSSLTFSTTSHAVDTNLGEVKEIEAETFNATLLRTSRSGRVFLFSDKSENNPYVGKILLIKSGKEEICAVRVLKSNQDKFIAKNVLPFKEIKVGQEYRVLKKIRDRISELIEEREKRMEDPDASKSDTDLSKEVAPEDPELDKGIATPPPGESVDHTIKNDEDEAEKNEKLDTGLETKNLKQTAPAPLFSKDGSEIHDKNDIEVSEDEESFLDPYAESFVPLEPLHNSASFQYGSILNYDSSRNPSKYSALGIRLAYNFNRYIIFQKKDLQDYMSIEMGLFYYTINGYQTTGDSVSVVPLSVNLKYSLNFGQFFSPYIYGGILRNNVASSSLNLNTSNLNNTNVSLGLGTLMRVGPNWALRVDYGIDMLAFGIMLKF